jgi:lysophospholipase L1-like esterase
MKVINAGVNSNTTLDALKRVEEDVLEHSPRLVIIEFSANDFFLGVPKQDTFNNLDRMAAMVQQKQAMVVLVHVAAGYFGDEYLDGFKRIAKKRRALLIPNVLKGILANPSLKSDQIHPNDAGYAVMAERIYEKIKPLLK